MTVIRLLVLGALATCASAFASPAQQWPMHQVNASHDGAIPNVIRPDSVKLRWSKQLSVASLYPVTAADGLVFVSGDDHVLRVLDASDGSTTWSETFITPDEVSPPSYWNSRVYIQVDDTAGTYLRCYDATTGANHFATLLGDGSKPYNSPTIFDGTVYASKYRAAAVDAVDATTGALLWASDAWLANASTPAVDEDYRYSHYGWGLIANRRDNGLRSLEIFPPDGVGLEDFYHSPVLGGLDDVLVVHRQGLHRFDLISERLAFHVEDRFTGALAVRDGTIYLTTEESLMALDQRSGALLWNWSAEGHKLAHNVVLSGRHVIVSSDSSVFLIDLATHLDVVSYAAAGHLAVAENSIYIAAEDGLLTALEFDQLPLPRATDPARTRYDAPISSVSISGIAVGQGDSHRVWFGDTEASSVQVIDDESLSCTVPNLGPGVFDVRVENSVGTAVLSRGLTRFPALEIHESVEVGGSLVCRYQLRERDHILALVGLPKQPVSIPPYAGEFGLAAELPLALAQFWPDSEFRLKVTVPFLPALRGLELAAQGLAVPQQPADHPGLLTNRVLFTLE